MKRRKVLALALASCLAASPAFSLDIVDRMLAELRAAGFGEIDVSRTLLGRTRITAESREAAREIVIDPRTGEILRDYWQFFEDGDGSGSGTGDSDDDDDDDDDDGSGSGGNSGPGGGDDSGGSDNSGSGGGGNSGSGGGNSGSGGGGNSGSGGG